MFVIFKSLRFFAAIRVSHYSCYFCFFDVFIELLSVLPKTADLNHPNLPIECFSGSILANV
jgi:hypothetical protein